MSGPVVLIPYQGAPVTAARDDGTAAAVTTTATATAGRQGDERDKQKNLAAD